MFKKKQTQEEIVNEVVIRLEELNAELRCERPRSKTTEKLIDNFGTRDFQMEIHEEGILFNYNIFDMFSFQPSKIYKAMTILGRNEKSIKTYSKQVVKGNLKSFLIGEKTLKEALFGKKW